MGIENLPGTPRLLDLLNAAATDTIEGNVADLESDVVDLNAEVDAIDTDIGAGTITNAEISPSAAIAYSKLNLANSIVSSDIATGTIADTDISSAAAISYAKLNLSGSVTNGDLAGSIKGNKFQWSAGTSPPSSPSTGDLWIYTGSGFYWFFAYDNSEATYKWKCIGGAPINAVLGDQTFTDNGTFVDGASAGPSVTLPRAGDYEIRATAGLYYVTQAATRVMEHGVNASSGTWDASAAGGTLLFYAAETTAGRILSGGGSHIVRGVSASAVMKLMYVGETDTGTAHCTAREIQAMPIRVI